jgi:hypothetical protein
MFCSSSAVLLHSFVEFLELTGDDAARLQVTPVLLLLRLEWRSRPPGVDKAPGLRRLKMQFFELISSCFPD